MSSTASYLQAWWVGWCLVENSGRRVGGELFDDLQDVIAYCNEQCQMGAPPSPTRADDLTRLGLAILEAAKEQEVESSSGSACAPPMEVLVLSISELHNIGLDRLALGLLPILQRTVGLSTCRKDKAQACLLLAAVYRETKGNEEALEYLNMVTPDLLILDASDQVIYHQSMGNSLKDQGKDWQALEQYAAAEQLARKSCPNYLGGIYYQFARYYLEHGNDPAAAERYLRLADEHGLKLPGATSMRWLLRSSEIWKLLAQDELYEAALLLKETLGGLPTKTSFHEEAALQNAQLQLARRLNLAGPAEWCARMSWAAVALGGKAREGGSVSSALALALADGQQGAEAAFWMDKAFMQVEQSAEEFSKPALLCSLAWVLYLFGLKERSVETFCQALSEADLQDDDDTRVRTLEQLAFASRDLDPELSRDCEVRYERLGSGLSVSERGPVLGTGLLLAKKLLSLPPDTLDAWPELLRTSKIRLGDTCPVLQALLDQAGEAGYPENTVLPPSLLQQGRGFLGLSLCGRGYLTFLKTHFGIPCRDIMEWVLNAASSSSLISRLYLEWLVNESGSSDPGRKATSTKSAWRAQSSRLRGLTVRLAFLEILSALRTEAPLSPSIKSSLAAARAELASFYERWRREAVIPDLEDHFAASTIAPPRVSRQAQESAYSHVLGTLLSESFRAVFNIDDPGAREAELQSMIDRLSSEAPLLQAEDLGVSVDNYLLTELGDRLELLKKEQDLPIVLELFQGKEQAYWIMVDLGSPDLFTACKRCEVEISRETAEKLAQRVLSGFNSRFSNLSEVIRVEDFDRLFSPVQSLLPQGREVLLRLGAPWASIPVEQLPTTKDGYALMDLCEITRMDRFGRWLQGTGVGCSGLVSVEVAVIGDPLGDLPGARIEAERVAGLFAVDPLIGSECTRERLAEVLPGKELIHIACHGAHFSDIGDFAALRLKDDYWLGQELGVLDLSSCKLAVLSACDTAVGSRFGSAPLETIADYLIEAGVKSVVASLWRVGDLRTLESMVDFYDALLVGESVATAMRRGFGRIRRGEEGVPMLPWVVFGKNCQLAMSPLGGVCHAHSE